MTSPPLPHSQKKVDAGRIPGPYNVPQVIEVKLIWTSPSGRKYSSFLHGSYSTLFAVNVANANTLFGAISASWTTNMASLSPTTCQLTGLAMRDMTSFTNPVSLSTAAGVNGTSASPAMPENVALVLTEEVNVRGRGAKGRVYVPNWATNADAGGGIATAAAQTAMNNWGTGILNAFTASGLTACVAKPARQAYIGFTGTQHNARAATNAAITAYLCQDLVWDTQRRRVQA
jgi:hypothetical protein